MRGKKVQRQALATIALMMVGATVSHAGDIQTNGKLISTVAVGTPPLQVTSTTRVDNLNAELLDGWAAESFLQPLANVLTVSPSGGDFTSIQAALDSITDADFDNWYAVLVGPGIYSEQVTLKSYVKVVGAGREVTEIVATGGEFIVDAATITGADDAMLRSLTVRSDASSGAAYAVGVLASGGKPLLEDLEVIAIGGSDLSYGIDNSGSGTLFVRNVSIHAVDATKVVGIFNFNSQVEVFDSEIQAYGNTSATVTKYAIENAGEGGGFAYVSASRLSAETSYLANTSSATAHILHSRLQGGSLIAGGFDACLFVTYGTTGYASTCP